MTSAYHNTTAVYKCQLHTCGTPGGGGGTPIFKVGGEKKGVSCGGGWGGGGGGGGLAQRENGDYLVYLLHLPLSWDLTLNLLTGF